MPSRPLISCLVVTNRPQWRLWVEYVIDSQTYPNKEVIVVRDPPTIGDGRNEAMRQAKGELLAWFDDDDWSHPKRLELMQGLHEGLRVMWVEPEKTEFVELETGRRRSMSRDTYSPGGLHNRGLYEFPSKMRGEWPKLKGRGWKTPAPLHLAFCHSANVMNTSQRHAGHWV